MKKPKIVLIGAGSALFGLSSLRDAFSHARLYGSELVFMDINETGLSRITAIAERMNTEFEAGYRIYRTTSLDEALPGADFVITSIAVKRNELWKHDFNVPKKYGVKHILGENGGPGALFHTMRNIPMMLEICRAMERHCPRAILLNFTNPESRMCLAVHKYTNIKTFGLCHQILTGMRILGSMLQREPASIEAKAYGLNHCSWFTSVCDRDKGEDLYPILRNRAKTMDPSYQPLSRYLLDRLKLFPASGDGHLGEYFNFAWEMVSTDGYDFNADISNRKIIDDQIEGLIDGSIPLDREFIMYRHPSSMTTPSREIAFDIIDGILYNSNELLHSVNLPNKGLIPNLPEDSIVEVPAIVSANGVNGLALNHNLPEGIAAILRHQISLQHLAVDAGAKGDRDSAFQALLLDPHINSTKSAQAIFNELMELNKPYMPQFS